MPLFAPLHPTRVYARVCPTLPDAVGLVYAHPHARLHDWTVARSHVPVHPTHAQFPVALVDCATVAGWLVTRGLCVTRCYGYLPHGLLPAHYAFEFTIYYGYVIYGTGTLRVQLGTHVTLLFDYGCLLRLRSRTLRCGLIGPRYIAVTRVAFTR